MDKMRAMHYFNQFFAGIGGEEKADVGPGFLKGPVGPGKRLQALLGESVEIVSTAYCGDDYFANHTEEVLNSITTAARDQNIRFLVAGPAFASGRHGFACAQVCHALSRSLGLGCVTAMSPQNPGIETYKQSKDRNVYALPTAASVSGMDEALRAMAQFLLKLSAGMEIGPPAPEGYIPRGVRRDRVSGKTGAERAVDMLLAKIGGGPFLTEVPMETLERVPVAPPLADLKRARLAMATSSGIIPKGNPDGFKAHKNVHWKKYSIGHLDTMKDTGWDVLHSGYNNVFMKANPNFGVPLDLCRRMEKEGVFASLYPYFYTTSGCNASIPNMQRIGREMVADMRAEGVDGVIMVST